MTHFTTIVPAPFGELRIVVDDRGRLCRIDFPGHHGPITATRPSAAKCAHVAAQLRGYFAGERRHFELELAPQGTEFQLAAWRALQRIPFGSTASYAQQAAKLGRPQAVRAIGQANGRNPIPIVVPCHRVIGKDGSLTGFGGGLSTKQWLLEHEQRVLRGRDHAVAGDGDATAAVRPGRSRGRA
ncbi:MAG TPA: methylated-DNA--[protein]-cysteine S-methyltransferase [Planctomycetota bacterium]|nr:methylated-DNA--[protein]-cysteine S-methyltransferase [Planctomycetota bacterium]